MAVINNSLDVLVISNSETLDKDKHLYESNAHTLKAGQLGVFDKNTYKSLDFATPSTATINIKDCVFATFTGDGIKLSGSKYNSEISHITFKKHVTGIKFSLLVDPITKFTKSTKYVLKIKTNFEGGHFSRVDLIEYTSSSSLPDLDTNRKDVIEAIVSKINNTTNDYIVASKDGDDKTSKLKVEFKDNTSGEISLLQGFVSAATVTPTNITFEQGGGGYVRKLEWEALNYRLYSTFPDPNERIDYNISNLLYADKTKNYDLLTIGYLDRYSTATFTGDIGRTLVIAFENPTTTTTTGGGNKIYDSLKKIIELKDLIK